MIVVSDTTAITTLMKCRLGHVLPELFERILIPFEVRNELLAFHFELPEWCEIRNMGSRSELARLRENVDPGEAEAILLALEVGADALLIDDRKGRREAESVGLTCLALPAVLAVAKQRGIIPSVSEAFRLIDERGRYRVPEEVAEFLLRWVGEA